MQIVLILYSEFRLKIYCLTLFSGQLILFIFSNKQTGVGKLCANGIVSIVAFYCNFSFSMLLLLDTNIVNR